MIDDIVDEMVSFREVIGLFKIDIAWVFWNLRIDLEML